MSTHWANGERISTSDVFDTVHAGLIVQLIATPRSKLVTCGPKDEVVAVLATNADGYDYLPVVAKEGSEERVVGLFHADSVATKTLAQGAIVERQMLPLSERHLIGCDTSILDFVVSADANPCRLVVGGAKITGLVALSDLQRLPVRAALFALITGFELTLLEVIRRSFKNDQEWLSILCDKRRRRISKDIERSKRLNGFVDALLLTHFSDKTEIVLKAGFRTLGKPAAYERFEELRHLRNKLAHAGEYAASPAEAIKVCNTVRALIVLRKEIADYGQEKAAK